jgi:hypothetical protein
VPTPRARLEWARRVQAEYRSAATTARVLHWMIQCGLARPLLDRAQRIVADELDHAELSHACLVALGGDPAAVDLDVGELAPAQSPDGPLASLVDTVLHAFCLGETFAVPLFAAMRPHTTHPTAAAALQRILRDEATHRAFGWDTLDALLLMDPTGVRARVEAQLPRALRAFCHAYGEVPDGPALEPAERAAGLLDAAAYRAAHDQALVQDIGPRLARRGMSLPGPAPAGADGPLPLPSRAE